MPKHTKKLKPCLNPEAKQFLKLKRAHDFIKIVIRSKSKIFDFSVLCDVLDERGLLIPSISLLKKVARLYGYVMVTDAKQFEYLLRRPLR